jgi:predicted MFS family arabinose efflux permease
MLAFRVQNRETLDPETRNLRQLRLTRLLDLGAKHATKAHVPSVEDRQAQAADNIAGTLDPSQKPRLTGQLRSNAPLIAACFGLQFAGFEAAATYIVPAFQAQGQGWLGLASPVVLYAALTLTGGWGPKLFRSFSPKAVAAVGAATYAAYTATLGLVSNSPLAVLAASALIGAGAALFWQGSTKILNGSVPDRETQKVHGQKVAALFVGAAAGTCLFAALLSSFSMTSLFVGCAVLNVLATCLLLATKPIAQAPESASVASDHKKLSWKNSFTNRKWFPVLAPLSFFGFGALALGTGALKLDAVSTFGLLGVAITGPVFRIVMGIGGLLAGKLPNAGPSSITRYAAATGIGLGLLAAAPHMAGGIGLLAIGTVLLGVFPAICHPLLQGFIAKHSGNAADRDVATALFHNWGNLGMCTAFLLPMIVPPVACYAFFGVIFLLGSTAFKRYHPSSASRQR